MKVAVGIWGCGIVGNATAKVFEELCPAFVDVYKYDIDKKKSNASPDRVVDCDFIFLCLPTPMKITGEISLEYLEAALKEIRKIAKGNGEIRKTIIIRSTSVSGSTDSFAKKYTEFDFAFCPEFLREAYAIEDALNPGRIVIGANKDKIYNSVESLFELAFGKKVVYIRLSCIEAETLKYLSNVFLFSQVIVSNELFFICEKLGVDYNKVQKVLDYDMRIGTHRQVPGSDGDFGAGKKCLVKDPSAFAALASQKGYHAVIIKTMLAYNDHVRKNHDWLEIPGATTNTGFKSI